jgi:ABC-type transporter Mla MlaB component
MSVELLKGDTEWTLVLSGVVDIFDAAALHGAARDAAEGSPGRVVAQLGAVEAMDTATTQVLLVLRRSLAAEGRSLSLEGAPASVLDFWRAAGLTDLA